MLLNTYLRKQCLKVSSVILMVLFLLMIGTLFASTLRTIARGILPPELLFIELGLRSIDVLSILLPVSFFLGVLVCLSQLYRNQEAVIMHAFGLSTKRMLLALMPLALLLSAFMFVVSFWMAPAAAKLSVELINEANKDASLMGLVEGKFQSFYGEDSVIYVSKVDALNNRVENVFANINYPDRVDTITAEYGYQFEEGGNKYIALFNGHRNEGKPGTEEYKLMRFDRNDIRLPELDSTVQKLDEKAKDTFSLLSSDALEDKALLHWRLTPALSTLVLFVLAVSLSRTSHREGKSINVIIGLLAYAALINVLTIAQTLLAQGSVPLIFGLWWVYAVFAGYGFWRISRTDGPSLSIKGSV
ncbi:LPS export ABC transporter permease LptF [Marinicella sp. W31]|uniref:LPS export ABC transporter permease LptF n=1 Tax=Marinicella sp. W31 TaxID=3023713 RepID=UPI003756BA78